MMEVAQMGEMKIQLEKGKMRDLKSMYEHDA